MVEFTQPIEKEYKDNDRKDKRKLLIWTYDTEEMYFFTETMKDIGIQGISLSRHQVRFIKNFLEKWLKKSKKAL